MKKVKKYLTVLGFAGCLLVPFTARAQNSPDPAVGSTILLNSVNYPSRYVRNMNNLGELTEISPAERSDASFIVREGLAGGNSVSFESVNYPGYYLRHQGFRIKLHKAEDSDLFRNDASFNRVEGLAGEGISFESVNYPGHYLRHCSFHLYIDNNQRGNDDCNATPEVFQDDVSFTVESVIVATPQDAMALIAEGRDTAEWSFGYGTVGGDFSPLTQDVVVGNGNVFHLKEGEDWRGVFLNIGSTPQSMSGGLVFEPNAFVMHPGNGSANLSKARFIAPVSGTYTVSANWTAIDDQAKKSFVWVSTNAVSQTGTVYDFTPDGYKEIHGEQISGKGGSSSFNREILLEAGEVLLFEVGKDVDNYFDDSLQADIKVEIRN